MHDAKEHAFASELVSGEPRKTPTDSGPPPVYRLYCKCGEWEFGETVRDPDAVDRAEAAWNVHFRSVMGVEPSP
jgi:hypothetical protein